MTNLQNMHCLSSNNASWLYSKSKNRHSQSQNKTKTFDSYLNKQFEKSFFLSPISPEDFQALLSTLKVHKAVRLGSIPTIILKQFKKLLSKPFTNLINLSFSTGLFPKFLNKLKLFQYLKKETNKSAAIIDLSQSYQILVKLLKNVFMLTLILKFSSLKLEHLGIRGVPLKDNKISFFCIT